MECIRNTLGVAQTQINRTKGSRFERTFGADSLAVARSRGIRFAAGEMIDMTELIDLRPWCCDHYLREIFLYKRSAATDRN